MLPLHIVGLYLFFFFNDLTVLRYLGLPLKQCPVGPALDDRMLSRDVLFLSTHTRFLEVVDDLLRYFFFHAAGKFCHEKFDFYV